MTKQFREFFVDEIPFWEGSFEEVQKWLLSLVEVYGENLYLRSDDDKYVRIYQHRKETDAEYGQRISYEKHQKELREKFEREKYERLKEKFGDK